MEHLPELTGFQETWHFVAKGGEIPVTAVGKATP